VLCFDSDEAGQNAAVRALDHLLASGLAVRVAVVPAPHDPDSYIKASGGDAFRTLIQQAEGFFDYYLNRLCATNDLGTDKGRLAVLAAMAEAVHKTGNSVLIDKYAQKTGLRLGVTPESVRAEFRKLGRAAKGPAVSETEEAVAQEGDSQPPSQPEYWLCKILLNHDDLVPWASAHLDPTWVRHPLAQQIVQKRIAADKNGTWLNLPAFLDQCDVPGAQNFITEVTAADRPLPNPCQQLADIATRLRNHSIDGQMAELLHRASQPEVSETDRVEFLRQREALRTLKKEKINP